MMKRTATEPVTNITVDNVKNIEYELKRMGPDDDPYFVKHIYIEREVEKAGIKITERIDLTLWSDKEKNLVMNKEIDEVEKQRKFSDKNNKRINKRLEKTMIPMGRRQLSL